MLKAMADAKGRTSFRVVMKQELEVYAKSSPVIYIMNVFWLYQSSKKDMTGEETMVLSHIQASGNEGVSVSSPKLPPPSF